MKWGLAVAGYLLGVVLAFLNDWSINFSGVVMAALGYWLGSSILKSNQNIPKHSPLVAEDVEAKALAERLSFLEDRVDTLSIELERLRLQLPDDLARADAKSPSDTAKYELQQPAISETQPTVLQVDPAEAESISLPAFTYAEAKPVAVVAGAEAERQLFSSVETSGLIERAFNAGRDWLLGGNTVVRIGIIVLFFGVAFLLKYAADNSLLPIEFRLAGTAVGATVLLAIGWRLRTRRAAYGLLLQGGGVGVLYLTVFSAVKLYTLIPASAALPLLVVICVLAAFLAIRQDAAALAFMGSAGGFLAPVLLSSGGGSHVALFSYYALLNAGILFIAWFKAWRSLNLLGFVFTFVIGATWGGTTYRPELFASTEPFLVLFFLMYVGIALLYAMRRELVLTHYVDGSLVFGTPIVATLLQAALVKSMPFGLAWSAVALSAFYLLVTAGLTRQRQRLGLLFDSMLALGIIFLTLAVPFAFSGQTTSAAWALEGAAILWLSVRQRRLLPLLFGLLMQLAAAVAFLASLTKSGSESVLPVLNSACLAMLMIALAGLFIGWWLQVRSSARDWLDWLPGFGTVAALWGLWWWSLAGIREILIHAAGLAPAPSTSFILPALVLFAILTAWLAHAVRCGLGWLLAVRVEQALPPAIALLMLGLFAVQSAPLTGLGIVAWPLALVSIYGILWRLPSGRCFGDKFVSPPRYALLHLLSFWTLCGLLAFEGYWCLRDYVPEGTWSWSAWAYGLGLCLLAVSTLGSRLSWPVAAYARVYQLWGAMPLTLLLWGWSIVSTGSDGDPTPLFWLPLLNPLDVAQLLAFIAVAAWGRRLRQLGAVQHPAGLEYLVFATVFLWFNALLLRTLHHSFGVSYEPSAVLASFRWQQVFMLGWGGFAFAAMWMVRTERLKKLCVVASMPLMLVLWLWTLYANVTQPGGDWMRLPLLNPLDAVLLTIYILIAFWFSRLGSMGKQVDQYRMHLLTAAGATGFLWLNAMMLRTLHHWTGIPYTLADMSRSMLAQATLTVFWTLCALATQIFATRRHMRLLWFVGGALLAITVLKLFVFDLSHVQGVERIISFIGVGVLLLLVGYFSPLPPKAAVPVEAGE